MSGMGIRYTADSNVIMGTVGLWKVRGKMPMKMHEKREFYLEKNGTKYVYVLDISKFSSILEEYRFVGEEKKFCGHSKVYDVYHEDGKLVVNVKKRPEGLA